MKSVLIVAATAFEIDPFLSNSSLPINSLITGVGLMNSFYKIQKELLTNDYDFVIQAGIAGSYTTEIGLGETVLVKSDFFGEEWIIENGKAKNYFEYGFLPPNQFPYKNKVLENNHKLLQLSPLELVKAATVATLTDDKSKTELILQQFNPEIETMEGAALHYICLMENIPFVQIRTISNYVGVRDKSQWKIKEAIENLNVEIPLLIDQIQKY